VERERGESHQLEVTAGPCESSVESDWEGGRDLERCSSRGFEGAWPLLMGNERGSRLIALSESVNWLLSGVASNVLISCKDRCRRRPVQVHEVN
jgi:hypothetical protein